MVKEGLTYIKANICKTESVKLWVKDCVHIISMLDFMSSELGERESGSCLGKQVGVILLPCHT